MVVQVLVLSAQVRTSSHVRHLPHACTVHVVVRSRHVCVWRVLVVGSLFITSRKQRRETWVSMAHMSCGCQETIIHAARS